MTPTLSAACQPNDELHQRAVLVHLLALGPVLVTQDEVRRALVLDESFAARDAVDRAVRDLRADGVLHEAHGFVVLTRAAARTAGLLESS
ncbi:MAG: hypothetical protein WC558_01190 [Patulibacter sp.]